MAINNKNKNKKIQKINKKLKNNNIIPNKKMKVPHNKKDNQLAKKLKYMKNRMKMM